MLKAKHAILVLLVVLLVGKTYSQKPRRRLTAEYWIEKLGMFPFGPTSPYYSKKVTVGYLTNQVPSGFEGDARFVGSHVFFMLTANRSQTVFYFPRGYDLFNHHTGGHVDFYTINKASGNLTKKIIGLGSKDGFIHTASPDSHTALKLRPRRPGSYALFVISSIPGHVNIDDTIPTRQSLLKDFPQHRRIINQFALP